MKTLLLVMMIIGASIMFIVFQNTPAFASCAVNEDWPDAPCFDVLPVNREEYRMAWAPYYDYKGSEWMEQKKTEILQAIENGTFMEWEGSVENSNVYNYYHSVGLVPNQYEYFFFEDEAQKHVTSPLQQFKSGIQVDEIQCKENLQLMIKASDGSPACIKPETKAKLVERGWAKADIR
jgi:hypothetical protein